MGPSEHTIPVLVEGKIVHVPSISSREKQFATMAQSRVEAVKQAGHLIGSSWRHKVYDGLMYLPPVEDALEIIAQAKIDALQYVEDINDCDDFHRKLVVAFLNDAYREIEGKKVRRPPYCFGIAESGDHAFNVMLNDDWKLRFIEPQTSQVWLAKDMPYGLEEIEW